MWLRGAFRLLTNCARRPTLDWRVRPQEGSSARFRNRRTTLKVCAKASDPVFTQLYSNRQAVLGVCAVGSLKLLVRPCIRVRLVRLEHTRMHWEWAIPNTTNIEWPSCQECHFRMALRILANIDSLADMA